MSATRMIQRELIERVPGPGRAVRHRLTTRGEEVRRAGARVLDGVFADSLGRLNEDELAELHRLLLLAAGAGQATPSGAAAPPPEARDARDAHDARDARDAVSAYPARHTPAAGARPVKRHVH